ncbi:uncharacterized protein BO97DRAFT_438224 [Aspergillus homomorphus CBS 101889]|uniref:Mitochondrial carrier n=1 Tax=Aspergillus homomorphus (strain CBS 101889) TaxID=1450537 RepID=A0A395HIH1_ASPHC|nr:hypothetical protein BO97DRAFT_438224 [Aspergillus homomorphus CBS 101889]RAL07607.1 hypothetical protein BO97DRAFT_438224 [Aspergillus homomorphus CBS 101889]
MSVLTIDSFAGRLDASEQRRLIPYRNLAVGAVMNIFQVITLGRPMEVVKTHRGRISRSHQDLCSPTVCGILGGISGGVAQAYPTMGMTTCMKTMEATRSKIIFMRILREKGIRVVNKRVNAVALRQDTGWSSRIGISRFAEETIRSMLQSMKKDPSRPASPNVASTFRYIFNTLGIKGLFRGVVPRIGVAAWATICMVGFGDTLKEYVNKR